MQIDWDEQKAESNLRKHDVSFTEAGTVFVDTLAATARDLLNSSNEIRYITIGHSAHGRILAVSHTDRGETIRIIGARAATRKEKKIYEES